MSVIGGSTIVIIDFDAVLIYIKKELMLGASFLSSRPIIPGVVVSALQKASVGSKQATISTSNSCSQVTLTKEGLVSHKCKPLASAKKTHSYQHSL